MTPRLAVLVLAAAASGCIPSVEARAPATLALHADGAVDVVAPSSLVSADIGYQHTGCCSMGFYTAAESSVPVKNANEETGEDRQQEEAAPEEHHVIDGGLEAGFIVPFEILKERLQLRARFGKAGTAPHPPLLGRSGYGASIGLLYRLAGVGTPRVDEFAPGLDVVVGYVHWGLGRERSAAGASGDSMNHDGIVVGLRLGAAYGVDFE